MSEEALVSAAAYGWEPTGEEAVRFKVDSDGVLATS